MQHLSLSLENCPFTRFPMLSLARVNFPKHWKIHNYKAYFIASWIVSQALFFLLVSKDYIMVPSFSTSQDDMPGIPQLSTISDMWYPSLWYIQGLQRELHWNASLYFQGTYGAVGVSNNTWYKFSWCFPFSSEPVWDSHLYPLDKTFVLWTHSRISRLDVRGARDTACCGLSLTLHSLEFQETVLRIITTLHFTNCFKSWCRWPKAMVGRRQTDTPCKECLGIEFI